MRLPAWLMRATASVLSPGGGRARLSILMYHRVLPAPDPLTGEVHARDFDVQMHALRDYFNVLPLAEAVSRLQAGTLPARSVAITFDDGYADNAEIALPILQRHGLAATFFVAHGFLNGGRMFNDTVIEAVRRMRVPTIDLPALRIQALPVGSGAEKRRAVGSLLRAVKHLSPQERLEAVAVIASLAASSLPDDLMMNDDQVRSLARAGMEIGGHTVNHPILTSVDPTTARREIEDNRAALGALIGRTPELFAYPNGVPTQDYRQEHVDIVRTAGYRAAVSTSWGAASCDHDVFQLPRFTPWDREPTRYALRLLHNLRTRRPVLALGAAGT